MKNGGEGAGVKVGVGLAAGHVLQAAEQEVFKRNSGRIIRQENGTGKARLHAPATFPAPAE